MDDRLKANLLRETVREMLGLPMNSIIDIESRQCDYDDGTVELTLEVEYDKYKL